MSEIYQRLRSAIFIAHLLLLLTVPCKGFHTCSGISANTMHDDCLTSNWVYMNDCQFQDMGSYRRNAAIISHRSTLLYSTLFDDDDDLDWDTDDDEEELDLQLTSIFDPAHNIDNSPNGNENESDNDNKKEGDIEIINLDELDDTDEDYYEQLFLQQSLKAQQNDEGMKNNKESTTVDISRDKDHTDEEMEVEAKVKSYEMMITLRKEWKEKVSRMRNESVQTRKLRRKSIKRKNLEERASFLALRALRMQTMPLGLDLDESSSSSTSSLPNKKVILSPTPTLSISSSWNYKRKGDAIDENESKLEQRLYGKRFKDAKKLYTRLLETVEEIRIESTAIASEMIEERLQKEISTSTSTSTSLSMSGGRGTNDDTGTRGNMNRAPQQLFHAPRTDVLDEVTLMNRIQQLRLNTLVHLSINGHSILNENDKFQAETDAETDTATLELHDISLEDLNSILRIRGNIGRRGRLPKQRSKVLHLLMESFSQPLF